MKSTKNIIYIVAVILVVVAQIYYMMTFYKQDKATIASNNEEIANVQRRIDQLEERLAKHEESKKELAQLENQKAALLATIPNYNAYTKFAGVLQDYFDLTNFYDMRVTTNNRGNVANELGEVSECQYTVQFTSTYEDSNNLVERINNMYQAANISTYSFDTSVQQREAEELAKLRSEFGDKINQIGTTNLAFSVFYRPTPIDVDEIYQSYVTPETNMEEVFNNPKKGVTEVTAITQDEAPPTVTTPILDGSKFSLQISDILTSGDTYMLSGPGSGDEHFIGLSSQQNTKISILVYNNQYELTIEDEDGNVKQTHMDIDIANPYLRIVSSMRPLEDVMPNVHVYIYNYTDTVMNVILEGTMTENIYIFNEYDKPVSKGQTKGNISLT